MICHICGIEQPPKHEHTCFVHKKKLRLSISRDGWTCWKCPEGCCYDMYAQLKSDTRRLIIDQHVANIERVRAKAVNMVETISKSGIKNLCQTYGIHPKYEQIREALNTTTSALAECMNALRKTRPFVPRAIN